MGCLPSSYPLDVFKRDVDNAEAYRPPGTYLVLAMNNQVLIRLQAGIPRGMARMSVAPPKTGKCTVHGEVEKA